jgi:hypothetical protein
VRVEKEERRRRKEEREGIRWGAREGRGRKDEEEPKSAPLVQSANEERS